MIRRMLAQLASRLEEIIWFQSKIMAAYLICYDIANPKRLAKVHRCTVKQAAFIQYSVYYFEGSKAELQTVLAELENIINKKQNW